MNQYDIRTNDSEDPNTPQDVLKAMKKAVSDAGDKYETFEVTHEPINLKAKLVQKKQAAAAKLMQAEQELAAEEASTAEQASTSEE